MTCDHCHAETSNGLALCERCQAGASVYLEFLPVYFRNLARWRPGRAGSREVPGSRVLYSGEVTPDRSTDPVSRALNEAGVDIIGWARALADDRGLTVPQADDEATSVAKACRFLLENLTSIATLEWAGEFVRTAGKHERILRVLTERVVPGWYAGACQRDGCGVPTYVVPGLTWVTCGGCGVTTYARDHLETILDEARGWVARPMRLAEAIVALVDTELSVPRLHKRISKWGERGRVQAVRRTGREHVFDVVLERVIVVERGVGPARYRFGEVFEVLLKEGATRLSDSAAS